MIFCSIIGSTFSPGTMFCMHCTVRSFVPFYRCIWEQVLTSAVCSLACCWKVLFTQFVSIPDFPKVQISYILRCIHGSAVIFTRLHSNHTSCLPQFAITVVDRGRHSVYIPLCMCVRVSACTCMCTCVCVCMHVCQLSLFMHIFHFRPEILRSFVLWLLTGFKMFYWLPFCHLLAVWTFLSKTFYL